MNHSREIEKFINHSIRNGNESIDEAPLHALFEQMTTEEINSFWFTFSSSIAFRKSYLRIPDWKSRELTKEILLEANKYHYNPKERGANRRDIIDRKDLLNHISTHLLYYIKEKIQSNKEFKNATFFKKLTVYLPISIMFLLPFIALSYIFPHSETLKMLFIVSILMYGLILLMYALVTYMLRRRRMKIIEKTRV